MLSRKPRFARKLPMTSRQNRPTIRRISPGRVPGKPIGDHPRGSLMKSMKLIGLAFGASLALSTAALAQDIPVAVAGPMTGGESAFGRQMKNGAEHGGGRPQRRRRRARQEARAGRRGRCLRSQAGALGRRKDRQREDSVRRRPLLLVVVDPGLRSLCRRQRAADHAGLDQPAVHRAQALERGARLRP